MHPLHLFQQQRNVVDALGDDILDIVHPQSLTQSPIYPQIWAKCKLFVDEVTKAILESGQLKETDGHYELAGSLQALVIPATLQDSLMARLDRLVTAKAVAQYAAVIGRQFAYE